ncbi:MAG: DUF4271 domain-containing protein [Bacteroidales bacterium]|nr:DUF4271 domain-containing protein [Bacteroidales bacterium]
MATDMPVSLSEVVERIWPESYIALGGAASGVGGSVLSFADTVANMVVVVAIIAFFLLAFVRIAGGLQCALMGLFNYKNLLKIEVEANLYNNRNTSLLFLTVVFAFLFANINFEYNLVGDNLPVRMTFIYTLLLFASYFLFRYVVCFLLNWVNGRTFFKYLARVYYTHAILGMLLITVGFVLYMIFPEIGADILKYYSVTALAAVLLIYFVRGNQIIISNGFSQFFWILYLCTLEILPLVVLGHVILS